MRFYLDAAPIIYLIEQRQPFATAIRSKLAAPGMVPLTSELARLECRVKPMRDGNQGLLQDFDDYFANTIAEIFPLTRDVVDLATEIRAQYNFNIPAKGFSTHSESSSLGGEEFGIVESSRR